MHRKQIITVPVSIIFFLSLFFSVALAGNTISLTGTVDGYSIVTDDGVYYDFEYSEKADELTENQSSRARVSGKLQGEEGGYSLLLSSYTLLNQAKNQEEIFEDSYSEEAPPKIEESEQEDLELGVNEEAPPMEN